MTSHVCPKNRACRECKILKENEEESIHSSFAQMRFRQERELVMARIRQKRERLVELENELEILDNRLENLNKVTGRKTSGKRGGKESRVFIENFEIKRILTLSRSARTRALMNIANNFKVTLNTIYRWLNKNSKEWRSRNIQVYLISKGEQTYEKSNRHAFTSRLSTYT